MSTQQLFKGMFAIMLSCTGVFAGLFQILGTYQHVHGDLTMDPLLSRSPWKSIALGIIFVIIGGIAFLYYIGMMILRSETRFEWDHKILTRILNGEPIKFEDWPESMLPQNANYSRNVLRHANKLSMKSEQLDAALRNSLISRYP